MGSPALYGETPDQAFQRRLQEQMREAYGPHFNAAGKLVPAGPVTTPPSPGAGSLFGVPPPPEPTVPEPYESYLQGLSGVAPAPDRSRDIMLPPSAPPPAAPAVAAPAGPAGPVTAAAAGRPAPRIGLQPGSPEWAKAYPESAARMAASRPASPARATAGTPQDAAESYLRVSSGGKPIEFTQEGLANLPTASPTTMKGLASRAYQPRPNAFSGMVGGIQTQGQLEQDAKAEGQFNDRWNARREQIDEEEQSAADTYLLGLKTRDQARRLEEDPYSAYRRKSQIDQEKAVGIKRGESQIRQAEIGNLLGEQEAIDQQIDAEADAKIKALDPNLPPEERQRRTDEVLARAEAAKRAFQQQLGLATGKTPATLYRDDDITVGSR